MWEINQQPTGTQAAFGAKPYVVPADEVFAAAYQREPDMKWMRAVIEPDQVLMAIAPKTRIPGCLPVECCDEIVADTAGLTLTEVPTEATRERFFYKKGPADDRGSGGDR